LFLGGKFRHLVLKNLISRKIFLKLPYFRQLFLVGLPNIAGFFFFLLSSLTYSQIWLITLVDDSQNGHISKLGPKKKNKQNRTWLWTFECLISRPLWCQYIIWEFWTHLTMHGELVPWMWGTLPCMELVWNMNINFTTSYWNVSITLHPTIAAEVEGSCDVCMEHQDMHFGHDEWRGTNK
jgi:hypothetical protein